MNKKIILCLIWCLIWCGWGTAPAQNGNFRVIPLPKEIKSLPGASFQINAKTCIAYPKGNADMKRNAEFLSAYLQQATGLSLPVKTKKPGKNVICLSLGLEGNPEGYRLTVNDAAIAVQGGSAAGVFHGIQTLRKAIVAHGTVVAPAVVNDEPRFSYRGAHLDVSRHYFTPDSIRRFIDMLALHHINRMHWHLTDDQGWRIEIRKYPRLTEVGSFRPETVIGHNSGKYDGRPHQGFYTQKEVREIVEYAQERYITIIPEIDMPGHMQAALAAYPELGCTGNPSEVWKMWGVSENVLCAGNDKVFQFIDDVLAEVTELFPSEYIHVGGDECPKERWKDCPKCQQRIVEQHLQADGKHSAEERLQSYVIRHAGKRLKELGRKMIGWDEILEGGLAPDATVMSWRGVGGGIEAAKLGHDVIMTPNTHMYFDYYQTDHIENEPEAIGGCLPVSQVYAFQPIPHGLDAKEAQHVIGVQANLWTEYIPTYRHAEYMELPRMAALSEVQWSPQESRDYEDFKKRLPGLTRLYDLQNYNYAKHLFEVDIQSEPVEQRHEVKVRLSTIDGAEIRYTLDGTEPMEDAPLLDARPQEELTLSHSCQLKAKAFRKNGHSDTRTESFHFNKATTCPVTLLQSPHPQYTYEGAKMLTDGLHGETNNYNTGRWLGFADADLEAIIYLGESKTVQSLGFNACVQKGSWVMDARGVEVSVSQDGTAFTEVLNVDLPSMQANDPNVIHPHHYSFPPVSARLVKVKIRSEHKLPEWHGAKGYKGFLFVDELIVE